MPFARGRWKRRLWRDTSTSFTRTPRNRRARNCARASLSGAWDSRMRSLRWCATWLQTKPHSSTARALRSTAGGRRLDVPQLSSKTRRKMKLVSFSASDSVVKPGFLFEDTGTVLDLTASGFTSALDVIGKGVTKPAAARNVPLSEVKLHAPLQNPPRIFAIGLNYRDHAIESGMAIPTTPV